MRIIFVHTPMATVTVEERRLFWKNFDIRYHAVHPDLRPMKRAMWELPHWMHWLGGVLVSAGYQDLGVVDLYGRALVNGPDGYADKDWIRLQLREQPGDVYLFSPMTVNLHLALQIATCAKELYPDSVNVFGGVVATPLADELATQPCVDYVVSGRGEYALTELVSALNSGSSLDSVGGLVYQQIPDGPVIRNTPGRHLSLADLPFPKVDLFPSSAGENLRYIRQVHSLGCPYVCTFCTIQTIGQRPSYFSPERVLAEIRAYRERYGQHHHIYFGDETFTLYPEKLADLFSMLTREGDITYDCQTRLNCLTGGWLLEAMYKSGCRWIEVGLETGMQTTLDLHKRGSRLRQVKATLGRVRDSGIATCSFMVNGFPDQTVDDMKRSIEWVCELISDGLLHASYFSSLVPYPGSVLFEQPERSGLAIRHHDYRFYHEDLPPVYDTRSSRAEAVHGVFLQGVRDIAEAMRGRSYLGEPPGRPTSEYGSFWDGVHT